MKIKTILAVTVVALAILIFAFGQKIKNLYALKEYGKNFEAETISENFRSFQKKYPSIYIPPSKNPSSLITSLKEDLLPQDFVFDGVKYNIAKEIEQRKLTSLLIIKDGNLIHEKYYQGNTQSTPVIIFSCTKSVMGLLTGIAYEKGFIQSLSDPVEKYAPELKGTVYEGVSIQNALNMSSGVQWIEEYDNLDSEVVKSAAAFLTGSLNAFTKEMKRARPQGIFNQYTSMDTQVLGMVIQGATKTQLNDFFNKFLWDKIYAEHPAYFLTDATGFPLAYGGLVVTPRDLAKIGLLMLNKGKNQKGEQVFSKKWIEESINPTESHLMPGKRANADSDEGYKNQWWFPIERDGKDFSAIGIYGQTLYINPEKNIIIASNSAYANYNNDKTGDSRRLKMFQSIAKHISETTN